MLPLLSDCKFNTCYISSSPFGYRPSLAASIIFLVIYAACLVGCILLAKSTRRWISFSVAIAASCVSEIVGYGVRIVSWVNPWDVRLYAVTTIALTIAPAFISTAMYLTVKTILQVLGEDHSPIKPSLYMHLMFVDFAAIFIQIAGFGVAFSDLSTTTGLGLSADRGGYLIAFGISLQLLALMVFLVLFFVISVRARQSVREFGYTTFHLGRGYLALSGQFKFFVMVVLFGAVWLLARGVYRITSLVEGFGESIARNETYFVIFDGLLIANVLVSLVFLHPVYTLKDDEMKTRLQKRDSNLKEADMEWAKDVAIHVVV